MSQYLSSGNCVEEVESAFTPIAGVRTSTAGFIGRIAQEVEMPEKPGEFDSFGNPVRYTLTDPFDPQVVTNWEEFTSKFGDIQLGNKILAHAVYGFFNNGGSRCWVNRVSDRATDADFINALDNFKAIDEIALVAIPGEFGEVDNIQNALLNHCEDTGDRFAILDGQRTETFDDANIRGTTNISDYGALYFPWIQVYDPVTNAHDYIPPSGHIAGIYARLDTESGVHKSPANEIIRGALNVEYRLNRDHLKLLNPAGINVIRNVDGNITVYGNRTLGGDKNMDWKYINLRRLFLFMRESIDKASKWIECMPSTPDLWTRISRNVTTFLTMVWKTGAFYGATPQEAFYVKCDSETNPPEYRDAGQVVTEIGVAVLKPTEFFIFRTTQWAKYEA